MATRGFEFAYSLAGNAATPVIQDFVLGETTAYKVGDLCLIQSDGYMDKVTNTTTEVTAVMMEAVAVGVAGTTEAKAAIVTRDQVWRCSSDASTASTALVGTIKTLDTADANTIDASDITNGGMIVLDKSETDSDGNLIFKVVFSDTTFGNA